MSGRRAALTGFAALALFGGVPAVHLAAAPASPAAVQPPAPAELDRLSLREVEIEAALPLARRGRVFRTFWLDAYFRRQPWYRPTGFDARDLPPAERARVDALVRYQASRPKAQLEKRETALQQRQRSARVNCPRDVVTAGAGSSGPPQIAVVAHGGGLTVVDVATGTSRLIPTKIRGLMRLPRPALSRDGARLLSVEGIESSGQTVSAWDAGTGQSLGKPLLRTFDMGTVYDLVPDGTLALVQKMDPRSWELWSLDDRRALLGLPIGELRGVADRVVASTDRRRVLIPAMGQLWLWRAKAAAPAAGPTKADGPVALTDQYDSNLDGDLSPDGRWVAYVGSVYRSVRLFEADRPKTKKDLTTPEGDWRFVRFSPDGRRVMAGTQAHGLAIWEVADGRVVWNREGAPASLECAGAWAAFFPNGQEVALVDDGGGLEILDLATRKLRPVSKGVAIASPEDDEIEEQLLGRALGQSGSARHLNEIPFQDQPLLFDQRLTEAEVLAYAKGGSDPRELETLIYARRGRPFGSPGWRGYAQERPWYQVDPGYADAKLTRVDRDNLALIARVRQQLKPRPPAPAPDPAATVPRSAFPTCPSGANRLERTDYRGMIYVRCVKIAASGGEVLNGASWIWLPTGRLWMKQSFVGGKEQGAHAAWYWSGALKEEGEMVSGERQGRWRFFHPSGRLAEEGHYEGGKLHGPRRRLFDDGKKALEARYEKGSPAGSWTAYYDNGRVAMALTFPDGSGERFLPNGKAWQKGEKIASCAGRLQCTSPLEQMDLDSLPPVIPGACPQGGGKMGRVSRGAAKPLLAGARRAWTESGENDYSPGQCIDSVSASCAPDIDGDGRDDVLAQISYRIPMGDARGCRYKGSEGGYWNMTALVTVTPPAPGGTEWTPKGLIGYRRFDAEDGGATIDVNGFVRLPSGEVGVRAESSFSGGDCDQAASNEILVARGQRWEVAAKKAIVECGESEEPEEDDVF